MLQYVHIVQCVTQPIGQFYYFVYDYILLFPRMNDAKGRNANAAAILSLANESVNVCA